MNMAQALARLQLLGLQVNQAGPANYTQISDDDRVTDAVLDGTVIGALFASYMHSSTAAHLFTKVPGNRCSYRVVKFKTYDAAVDYIIDAIDATRSSED